MKTRNLQDLKKIANAIRQDIIRALVKAGSGHSAGPLGMADVFTALYFGGILDYDPKRPDKPERDRLVLSCGHINPVFYATLAHAGYFPVAEFLTTLRKFGGRLHGHPHNLVTPGVENSSGPLGQGLSQAIGMALAAKLDQAPWRVYAILSDGEHDEGQTWEAILMAAKYRLNNLTVLIDRNNIQIDGFTEDIMPLEPLDEKYQAFGWHVLEIDGHNIEEIIDGCHEAQAVYEKPVAIICHTIPGKGVPFMERDFRWHGKPPTAVEAQKALKELRTLEGRVQSELD